MNSVVFTTKNLHLNTGEIVPAAVSCTPDEPLEIFFGACHKDSIKLPDSVHIALGRCDPHVHFRESALPTPEEFEEYPPNSALSYEDFIQQIRSTNHLYNIDMGSLAGLKGGVTIVGAMGNVPWSPVGAYRHQRTQTHYQNRSRLTTVVWPRIEPGVPAIDGHEGKDFGSTFGGSGITGEQRAAMYKLWKGEAVSFHNDQARPDQTIQEFKDQHNPPDYLLHHLYFDESTVLASQKETLRIAREAQVRSLLARHIPTGSALDHWHTNGGKDIELPMEVGLDYLYWNRDMLKDRPPERSVMNFRRPALPSEKEQQHLIELTRDLVRQGKNIFIGSDHAPHPIKNKQFKNGLPGSPGTRCLEHTLQYAIHLYQKYGYTWHDIDLLMAINPAKHMEQFYRFPYPVGEMKAGYACNLTIFDTKASYTVAEDTLRQQLHDPQYHSLLTGEKDLFGKTLYTVVNGTVYDVEKEIYAVN